MQTVDVAIVGGGVMGCSLAFHLAARGVRSGVVFERKHVASGATGVCPGGIRQQFEGEAECRLAQRSLRFFEQANERLQPEDPFFLERSGYLFLAESDAVLDRFRRNVAMQNGLGIPSQIVSPREIHEIVPALVTDGLLGGAFCAEDGFLEDCDGISHRMLRIARDAGFTLALQEVVSVTREGNAWRVATASDAWLAKQVVIAAASESKALVSRACAVELPIVCEPRRLAYTEPRPGGMMNPLVVALERSFAGKQLLNGVFYLGWLAEQPEADDLTFIEKALTAGTTLLPTLGELGVRRVVTGTYDNTPDHRPILGEMAEGLFLAAGFSGHGFMLAPAVGEILAQLMVTGEADPVLRDFALERFSASRKKEGLQI